MTYSNTERNDAAPKLRAIRAVFTAMFDAVDVAGEFDEDKWQDLIAAFNATGRMVFGWPHLESREEDIFAALDGIAEELEQTKGAIVQTSSEARSVLFELHQALDPLLPEEDDGSSDLAAADATTRPVVLATAAPVHPSGFGASDIPVRQPDSSSTRLSTPTTGPPYASDPQRPSADDEKMFEVVRQLGDEATFSAIDRALGLQTSRAYNRFRLLADYGTLPADMVAFRESRKGKARLPLAVVPDDWEPLCMDATDFRSWQAHNALVIRTRGRGNGAKRPCDDCPLAYAEEMRALGKCNGEPGLAA